MTHRWSGWPGAWCLDCGIEDQNEIALADSTLLEDIIGKDHNPPCPEPGSNRCNPYMAEPGDEEHPPLSELV